MKKAKIFSKRMVVLAVLLLALSGAVYLNWQYNSAGGGLDLTGALSESKTEKYLGDAQYVNAEVSEETTAAEADNYFTKTRAERESSRNESIKTLQSVLENVKSTDEAKQEASKQIAEIARIKESENSVESIIKAKGFDDCVAVLTDENISIVVKCGENGLLDSETVQIQDAVTSSLKISLENIKIIEIK